MVEKIASSSKEQTITTEEINRSIMIISDSAKNTVQASKESFTAGTEIAQLASHLTDIADQFKT